MTPDAFQYQLFRSIAPAAAFILAVFLAASRLKPLRANPASKIFSWYCVVSIGFLVANTLENSAATAADNLFWSRVIYLFVPYITVLWFSFAVKIAGDGRPLERSLWAFLLLVPVVTSIMVFSDRWMIYMWSDIRYMVVDGYVISVRKLGPWFYFYAIYAYAIAFSGIVVAARAFVLRRSYYRIRSLLMLVGVLIPVAANLVYLLRPLPGVVKDFTSIAYAVSAVFFFFALFRLDVFSILPVARTQLVERLRDGIVVFDAECRIVDANPAALKMLGAGEKLIGRGLRPIEGEKTVLPDALIVAAERGTRGVFDALDSSFTLRHYAVDPIELPGGLRPSGRLVVIRDETELRDALSRVEELARMDVLTGLSNRRGFSENAEALFTAASRHEEPLSAAMFDLDFFKSVNDERGHPVGDAVLRGFARILSRELRGSDAAGRIGGEEFALALPRTDAEGALIVCERVRKDFAREEFMDEHGDVFHVTVSVGIAAIADEMESFDALLALADSALYAAKARGRNRTVTAGRSDAIPGQNS